jgi:hypothetical protein
MQQRSDYPDRLLEQRLGDCAFLARIIRLGDDLGLADVA